MRAKDPLFQLIKSLYQTEKRYFKVHASRHTIGHENNYVRLFDAIESMKEYDEEKLKKHFDGETFIKYLPSEKNYLYNIILGSLQVYHSENFSIDFKLRGMLDSIELLFEKGLFDQAVKIVQQAQKIAYKYERYEYLLQLLSWERKTLDKQIISQKDLQVLIRKTEDVIEKMANYNAYANLFSQLALFTKQKLIARTSSEVRQLDVVMKNPLLRDEKKALSIFSKHLYNKIYLAYYSILRNYQKCYVYAKKNMDMMSAHPELAQDDAKAYVMALTFFAGLSIETGHEKDFQRGLALLRDLPKEIISKKGKNNIQELATLYSYSIEIGLYHISKGLFNEGAVLINKIEEQLLDVEDKIGILQSVSLYYSIANIYFGAQQYSKALKWLNKLLNKPDHDQFQDIYSFSKILVLIIHYELGNHETLPYVLKSTYRFLSKRKQLFKVEALILDFIRKKFSKISPYDKNAIKSTFVEFRRALLKVLKHKQEQRALEYFDFVSWLDSKVENRSFASVVQAKKLK